jgi:GT2 family glycosyltransferase
MMASGISAIVTAYTRVEQTLETIRFITACRPAPDEVLVHVDADQVSCATAIREAFPSIRTLISKARIGPGGARNKLIREARYECVASFDDDSFPIDTDYFARVSVVFDQFHEAAVVYARVYHRGEPLERDVTSAAWVSDFAGCACVYRRSKFIETRGYVPLPIAYGMEEVDLALQLHCEGSRILYTPYLRVRHDTTLEHHRGQEITSGSIANLFLLAFLRYPLSCWWIGVLQVCRRVAFLLRKWRWRGILTGFACVPKVIRTNARYRRVIPKRALYSYLRLRRHPVAADDVVG